MGRGNLLGLMEEYTRENMNTIRKAGLGNIFGPMGKSMWGNGKTESSMGMGS